MKYSVLSVNPKQTATIRLDNTLSNNTPSFIHVIIQPCPAGFEIHSDKRKCDCSSYLLEVIPDLTCTITGKTLHAPGSVWIGNYTGSGLVAHQHCPLVYCNPDAHSFSLDNQDEQCTSNRSGVLCGGCQPGLSMTLGTAKCTNHCSNYYLFLIIPFALAGVVLVVLLLKCNLTIKVGTINALTFYANIVHANRTILFPQKDILIITRILTVPVAWLNLDFGIETCFYKGMTVYGYTWVQFVFPVYIWMLVLIIIFTSRYSVTVSIG